MRIAFVEPSISFFEPLGISYLASSLKKAGHIVRYFESPRKNFFIHLKDFNPHVLAYSITTGKHKLLRNLNALLRKNIKAISIFGGPHCTFFPEFIETDDFIDGICLGEGEHAIVELLNKIERGESYHQVDNWYFRMNGKIVKNPVRGKIKNLDTLPFPDREIIYLENPDLRSSPIKRFITSRGCPFSCSYCFNKKYNLLYQDKGEIVRSLSPKNIVKEILAVKQKYSLTFVRFTDDIFGMNIDLEEFANIYKKEVDVPFLCNIRPNLVERSRINLLKKAGCVAVCLAIESANDTIRNQILNRKLSLHSIESALFILNKEKIRVYTQNIIANPGETFAQALETLKLNIRYGVDFAECFILTPYPGTDLFDYCKKNNYFTDEVDILQKSYWIDSPLLFTSEMQKRYLVNFHKFFSFVVQHPFLLPVVKLLIRLPPNNLFVLFNRFYDFWRISHVIKARFTLSSFFATVKNTCNFILTYFMYSLPYS